ncbi:hypothetical protein [Ectopseudomonas alcaliphila]|uniref:Uncharacterized protein n=1 Tax=Ectopseudomonas alcaliphila TaxID=101564 RepID=A0A1G6WHD2_9GAMM|nr:hypothetical protein [Pseudomonas alcaliphila]MDX5992049.1 hypothetical protein [Pseudomonas alcaliphila]SDD65194.1 hypothetical protein SAMN05216575_1011013 [Pseudomonas alcaliphila]
MITLEALERRNNLGFSIVAGSALSGLLYIGFSFYGSLYTGFYCLTCFASIIWLSLSSKRWNPLLGLRQLYIFDWVLVALIAWFMTNSVMLPGHKMLVAAWMTVCMAAAVVSARRKRVRA